MNKADAKKKAQEGILTIGDLRFLIEQKRGSGGMSKVNPSLTKEQALDIFEAAIKDRENSETPKAFRFDVYRRRDVPSRDSLLIKNILRECA